MSDLITTQVAVSATPALFIAKISSGQQILVYNAGAASTNDCYIGPAGVASTTGAIVPHASNWAQGVIDLPPEVEMWVVCAGGQTTTLHVTQIVAD